MCLDQLITTVTLSSALSIEPEGPLKYITMTTLLYCLEDFSWDMWKDQDSDEQRSHYHSQNSLDSVGVRTITCIQ